MSTEDHGSVLEQAFDQAVGTVLEAFVSEGFTITPIDGGDLQHTSATGDRWRYALIEAALPELSFVPCGCQPRLPAILGCRISLFEMTGACTLVTASHPLTRYPLLASLVPRLADRIGAALRRVARREPSFEAA